MCYINVVTIIVILQKLQQQDCNKNNHRNMETVVEPCKSQLNCVKVQKLIRNVDMYNKPQTLAQSSLYTRTRCLYTVSMKLFETL